MVAKSKQQLLADVPSYKLADGDLLGDYSGALDNGGERLALLDAAGKIVDEMVYDDERPWPMAADALGAGEAWLPATLLPLEKHKFMGRSLERISIGPGRLVANWAASALDGATPGRRNGTDGVPLPVMGKVTAGDGGDDPRRRPGADPGPRGRRGK